MTDIVTTATEVAKRLRASDEDPSAAELVSDVEESTDESSTEPSPIAQYAKKAAIIGAVAIARRILAQDEQGIDEDATRVEVVDPDEVDTDEVESESESEESGGGLLSLKRILLIGAIAGAGYVAVKKLRSRGDQHTLEEWDEPAATDDETATASESAATASSVDEVVDDEDAEAEEVGTTDTSVSVAVDRETEDETAEDETEADRDESATTTDPTDVADGEPVDLGDDESIEVEDDESVGAEPGEVAVEEDVAEEIEDDEDVDEEGRLSE